ncbi:hypothetical protein HAX54_051139, partial [Datura stramonium]|nr:hypothetical protein [Datura stramonium]
RALMDLEKHEIMFQVKDESIIFKAGRGLLLPIRVGDICVVNVDQQVGNVDKHVIAASSKRKKAKSVGVKQYLCGTICR